MHGSIDWTTIVSQFVGNKSKNKFRIASKDNTKKGVLFNKRSVNKFYDSQQAEAVICAFDFHLEI